jgi:hypothetical protein
MVAKNAKIRLPKKKKKTRIYGTLWETFLQNTCSSFLPLDIFLNPKISINSVFFFPFEILTLIVKYNRETKNFKRICIYSFRFIHFRFKYTGGMNFEIHVQFIPHTSIHSIKSEAIKCTSIRPPLIPEINV